MSRMKNPPPNEADDDAFTFLTPERVAEVRRRRLAARKSRIVRSHGPVRNLAVARLFIRGQCQKTERIQRLQTCEKIADAARRWAVANSMPAFITTLVMRAALECELVREFNDGFRPTWYALQINPREIDLPSNYESGEK